MAKKKLRPLGHTLLDLEKLLLEMTVDHDLQWGDVLNLVRGYLEVHVPGAQEQYTAGGSPIFYYGPTNQPSSKEEKEQK
jgi:hypothetical protein